ncbi:DNA-methyltransferase [Tardiphaga sp. 841_E9_N1_2]|uniref:DNA-methyltransferase n=1 Tax=Tardiphaga sp. 841_E9_N1_2 TaxID=3240762 RepID=UPI003F2475FB
MLRTLPDESVHCCVTSPPYFGLRDYGVDGQIGLEATPEDFVAEMVDVFREVKRVLRDDGTLWLNLGDSYAGSGRGGYAGGKGTLDGSTTGQDNSRVARGSQLAAGLHSRQVAEGALGRAWVPPPAGLKQKDLIGIPWMVAFALRADGWWLRQWHPWVKRNPMPESTQDRPTSACETIFLLSKAPTYFYDYEAVKRTMAESSVKRLAQDVESQDGSTRGNGGAKTNGTMKAVGGDKQRGHSRRHAGFNDRWDAMEKDEQRQARAFRNSDFFVQSIDGPAGAVGNDREITAFDVATQPFRDAHFATFPPSLIEPMVLAGCPIGGTVIDPFGGAGTTGLVADRLQRDAILIELNPEYAAIADRRIRGDAGMFAQLEATAIVPHDKVAP